MKYLYIIYIILFTVIGMVSFSCTQKTKLFQEVSSSVSNIGFENKVPEDDKYNVLEYMNIYTGAGVAAGDINNDGLVDLFFSGNKSSCEMYLNKGDFKFENITKAAGLITDRWCTGVSMVDINNDGFLDIYVNVAGSKKFGNTTNLLYINSGFSPSPLGEGRGEVTFIEKAAAYGIADSSLCMNASFFDYDKDGDLDLFLITNPADELVAGVNSLNERKVNGESEGTDILYRNNGNESFTNVSREAGILLDGYSLGAAISDVNNDGWPDIYVSNDFLSNDILYINNGTSPSPLGEGRGEPARTTQSGGVTFTDKIGTYLKHSSFASMGNDIADINNDGLTDIFTLDMLPEDNYRKKMIIPPSGYDKFQLSLQKGYTPQYTRNALQLNNGEGPNGESSFSDIAFYAGVSATDWSWAALWADYDNDGDKDLYVSNGFYRDLGNLDYINYQARLQNPMGRQDIKRAEKLKAIKELASIPLQDYFFENNGDLTFAKKSSEWGFTEKGFSNGACYADLDNDGDLDLIINQFNSKAKIFENKSNEIKKNNFLTVQLKGDSLNRQGIGAKIWVYTKDTLQFQEMYPSRGYESSMEPLLHFGIGKNKIIDSLVVQWPDGSRYMKNSVEPNKKITIAYKDADDNTEQVKTAQFDNTAIFFTETSGVSGVNFKHTENDFVDFKLQPLLPHMHSQDGPGIAAGDINGDGREDVYIGGASGSSGSFFIQQANGNFLPKALNKNNILSEETGLLLFDADNDNDLDLYTVSGGSENAEGSDAQQDRLYLNKGKGDFTYADSALPNTTAAGSCVVANDYDHDGDLDLFIGGRVVQGSYPLAPRSYLLRNDIDKLTGKLKYTDVTNELTPVLQNIGMVTSAIWTDYDNDGWTDLMVVGEFMPVTFIKNEKGKKFQKPFQLANSSGWWNSITAGDFDEDGDIDYVAGNLGLNSRHKASPEQPLCIYAKDFDKNGRIDPVMCYYVQGENYIYPSRDEMIKQVNAFRGRFQTYESFAKATFAASFTKEELADAIVVKSYCFESSYIENKGNGIFERRSLPAQAQFAPLYGMLSNDYTGDGHPDILLTGNSYATEASTGRYDAFTGLLLAGDGKGNFKPLSNNISGFFNDGDAKGLAQLSLRNGKSIIMSAGNSGPVKSFLLNESPSRNIAVNQKDAYAIIYKKDGSQFKQEFYFGNSYLSNSSRMILTGPVIKSISIFDVNGVKREINL
jgi:enediyne biosynthesis protein E4